jgi:cytochrome oxidase Cu insertion factor (SCO1/SenC/PrrC family)
VLSKPLTWLLMSAVAALLLLGVVLERTVLAPSAGTTSSSIAAGLHADIVIPPKTSPATDFTLTDQDGKPVSVSALRGQVLAITFLDSHCKQLCPLEGDQLGQIQQSLGARAAMTLLVVSIAPATDTPDSERAFAATHHWSGPWHWLVGTADQLAAVWKAYSIGVQITPTDILHSMVVYLVDRSGFERAGFAAGLVPELVTHDVRFLETQA